MVRWGFRMFESDLDLDLTAEFDKALGKEEADQVPLFKLTDKNPDPELAAEVREKLNQGIGVRLIDHYRQAELGAFKTLARYQQVLLAAMLMRAGARIPDADLRYVRGLVTNVPCRKAFDIHELGFCAAGKAQFLAALDGYAEGVPRDFREASCFHCGKAKADTGSAPMMCGRCRNANYCNKDCQKAHWRSGHKLMCDMKVLSAMLKTKTKA